ncbi:hypothetical protein LOK49_LG07G01371 [Camellia lanceoleosa]|uniref:Uncharacterized protein n=1 Tax=Camellia lanceoleosa TaxID=1840588 RepID=A0ACC0GZS8_9ERIC|nr:hypothetical protein LOK49_LG07G01371 [Camellia lanceoleosa]
MDVDIPHENAPPLVSNIGIPHLPPNADARMLIEDVDIQMDDLDSATKDIIPPKIGPELPLLHLRPFNLVTYRPNVHRLILGSMLTFTKFISRVALDVLLREQHIHLSQGARLHNRQVLEVKAATLLFLLMLLSKKVPLTVIVLAIDPSPTFLHSTTITYMRPSGALREVSLELLKDQPILSDA